MGSKPGWVRTTSWISFCYTMISRLLRGCWYWQRLGFEAVRAQLLHRGSKCSTCWAFNKSLTFFGKFIWKLDKLKVTKTRPTFVATFCFKILGFVFIHSHRVDLTLFIFAIWNKKVSDMTCKFFKASQWRHFCRKVQFSVAVDSNNLSNSKKFYLQIEFYCIQFWVLESFLLCRFKSRAEFCTVEVLKQLKDDRTAGRYCTSGTRRYWHSYCSS